MHPEILRELNAQRGREMRERAHQARLARMAIRSRRRGRAAADEAAVVLPAIPDYVDGSFRSEPAGHQAASETGQAPVAQHAA
jgi:hypothetical protein